MRKKLEHATQAERDAYNDKQKKTRKKCTFEGCTSLPQTGCGGHCIAHATQAERDAVNVKKKKEK
jgi:hypothetical protein